MLYRAVLAALAGMFWVSSASGAVPPLYTPAPSFNLNSRIVSTHVFHWYGATTGQLSGPWRPFEGRAARDGSVDFWKRQIKDVMDSNIDLMYVHLIPAQGTFAPEQQRINLFQAAGQLRGEGYKVPRMAPFLDPVITWEPSFGRAPIDVATTAGKDAWTNQYGRFYDQYYSVNADVYADDFIGRIGNKPIINTWLAPSDRVFNMSSLTRADVESRLASKFGALHPTFNNGVHAVRPVNSPAPTWSDEAMVQFESNAQYLFVAPNANGVQTAQMKPGYWDQNIRNPGQILKRDGGVNYKTAWDQVVAKRNAGDPLYRVNIESWNEYDEGSGIYSANAGAPFRTATNTSTDTWSTTNKPREYIDTTAASARLYNDTPDRDATVLYQNFPSTMFVGQKLAVTMVMRNEGDIQWTDSQGFKLGQQDFQPGEVMFLKDFGGRDLIPDGPNEIATYGGIFRGRPVIFDFNITAPSTAGLYQTHWGMVQEGVTWFGQSITVPIVVLAPEPAIPTILGIGLLAWSLKRRRA